MSNSEFIEKKILQYRLSWYWNAELFYTNIHRMNSIDFEKYMVDYYNIIYNFALHHTWKIWMWDWGIDGKWFDNSNTRTYIQCKKLIRTRWKDLTIWVVMMRDFFAASMSDFYSITKRISEDSYPRMIFISSVEYTWEARKFAEKNKIELVDIYGLIRIFNRFPHKKYFSRSIYSSQQSLWNMVQIIQDEDLEFYYKEVRKTIAYKKNIENYWYIFTDTTLKLFTKHRVHNLDWLLKVYENSTIKEKKKLEKYKWEIESAVCILGEKTNYPT